MACRRIFSLALVLSLQSGWAATDQDPCAAFDRIDKQVRDRVLSRPAALEALRALVPVLDAYSAGKCPGARDQKSTWIFPLQGYRQNSIGGKRGSGFTAKGYDYFDGKLHHAHPAHDIFIRDGNQDTLEDRTGKPVRVLSVVDGIVAGLETQWQTGSDRRGGLYVLVYHAATRDLFYYAHLRSVSVRLGDCVAAGQPLGEVGRSGKNAALPKSPTHLHFVQLRLVDGYPRPVDPYPNLMQATRW